MQRKDLRKQLQSHAVLAPPAAFGWYERLSEKRKRFVDEYLLDMNGWQAAVRAKYHGQSAYELLNDETVQKAIKERQELASHGWSLKAAEYILGVLQQEATYDPSELTEAWQVPCRYCWGENGQYQFTKNEMDRMLEAYNAAARGIKSETLFEFGKNEAWAYARGKEQLPFDHQGGDGYTINRRPNHGCSECSGQGMTIGVIHDTRYLSPAARRAYRGIKFQSGKMEILMADKAHAVDQLSRHYGVAVERKEILIHQLSPDVVKQLTTDELMQAIEQFESRVVEGEFSEVKRPGETSSSAGQSEYVDASTAEEDDELPRKLITRRSRFANGD